LFILSSRQVLRAVFLACFVSAGGNVLAAPYVPQFESQVLEHLPFKANDPVARELSELRGQLRRNPRDIDTAVKLARRYYDMVGEEGDPRYLGYAQAALAPWWDMQEPPLEVQVMRASIRQFRHDFAGAIHDLTRALERDPSHPQARSLRAIIHIVQARYPQAKEDCSILRKVGDPLIGLGCEAMVDGLTGNAGPAYDALNRAYESAPNESPAKKMWLLIRLGELAERLNRRQAVERHFKDALALGITDTFLLAAYADFLLAENRPNEVVGLLKDKTRSDTLLLRLVLASRRLNLPTAKELENALAARYAAAQMRGDTTHQQEEARFTLEIGHDPKKALALALENWKVQLEPRDAEIVLEAAIAAKDPVAARPVLNWLERTRIEDKRLQALGQQLKGARS
jgi:tetratricopeptide (TPR) repeat protein